MKMRLLILLVALLILPLLRTGAADNADDERWRADRAKYDLLDREKLLTQRNEELGLLIYDLKQKINTLTTTLDASQDEADRVKHELIIVRVKLLH